MNKEIIEKVMEEVMEEAWYSQEGYQVLKNDKGIFPIQEALKNFKILTEEAIKLAIKKALSLKEKEIKKKIETLEKKRKYWENKFKKLEGNKKTKNPKKDLLIWEMEVKEIKKKATLTERKRILDLIKAYKKQTVYKSVPNKILTQIEKEIGDKK